MTSRSNVPEEVLLSEARVRTLNQAWDAGLMLEFPHDARQRMRLSATQPHRKDDGAPKRRVTMHERYRVEARGEEDFGAFVRRIRSEEGAC